ncbi:hypothetical protein EBT25_03755 [bacterium]|nr:hypothetical protein [bacterium]
MKCVAVPVRACQQPPKDNKPALPKRVARARRIMESKRLDSFREIHESLKKTAKDEQEFVKSFFKNTQDMWDELSRDDEEKAEAEEE